MKNRIQIVLGIVLFSVLLFGCSRQSTAKPSDDDLEVVHIQAARLEVPDLDFLIEKSDLIVIGEFAQETEQIPYKGDEIEDILSTNTILVKKVLKGEVGEEPIKIAQRYGIVEEEGTKKLYTVSEMTPMKKGEQWIFFLAYNEQREDYMCIGDYQGRYPVPTEEILDICSQEVEIKAELFGVYDTEYVKLGLYTDIVRKFDMEKEYGLQK